MKFGFIAGKGQKSFDSLAERAQTRGHEVMHIPLPDFSLSRGDLRKFVEYCRDEFDALHYYAGLADPIGVFFGRICEELQVPLLNNRYHIAHQIHDKMFQVLSFVHAGLPVPKTEFSREPNWDLLSAKLGTPLVAKRVRGTHGKHVHKITGAEDLSVIDNPSSFIFQEFVEHQNDIRVLVLKGRAVCCYKRFPAAGDFRSNLARGGRAEALIDEFEKAAVYELAEQAVKVIPLDLAGVDIIKRTGSEDFYLIEINVNPSWYGIVDLIDMPFEDALLDTYEHLACSNSISSKVN